ncbi:MAG: Hsp20/alpha crystallin family protein [Undibacterium sp.]|nr:Hsp20/alpha crystallin family protein [Undibacterium sp.]
MLYLNPRVRMLAEAIDLFESADRLQRQFFRLGKTEDVPSWEPPIDMYGNDEELFLLVAFPGVAPDSLHVSLEEACVSVRGERVIGRHVGSGNILCLEIPYGRFERRIALPIGNYRMVAMQLENGCLRLHLGRIK